MARKRVKLTCWECSYYDKAKAAVRCHTWVNRENVNKWAFNHKCKLGHRPDNALWRYLAEE